MDKIEIIPKYLGHRDSDKEITLDNLLGNKKEDFDYYKNQFRGSTPLTASVDRIHDRKVNEIGRQRAQSSLYSNSKDACASFRVRGINEKY